MSNPHGKSDTFATARKTGGRVLTDRSLVDEFIEKEMSRRALLRNTFLATAGTYLGGSLLAGCGSGRSDGDGGIDAAPDTPPPPMHLVGMGYDADHDTAMRAALAETIGLSFVRPGDTVFLKVNTNSGDPFPYSTSPATLRMLAPMLRDAGASNIIVGDRSFWGDPNTAGNFVRNGIATAASDIGATLYVLDTANVDWLSIPQTDAANWVGGFRLPLPVVQANHVINLPCVKTHFIANITMALKLVLGIVNPDDRRRVGNLDVHVQSRLYHQVSQANLPFTPSLNILDGHRALVTGGPTPRDGAGPTLVDPGLVVVSTDRIATDVTGIAILKTLSPSTETVTRYQVWNNPTIASAVSYGVDNLRGPAGYDLSGPTVSNLDTYRNIVLSG